MTHVLFVTEKWRDARPGSPPTNNEHNLFGSLESAGLATFSRLHFDEYFWEHKKLCDDELRKRVKKEKPDVIVFCLIPWFQHLPSLTAIAEVSNTTKSVFVWPDVVWDCHFRMAESYEPFSVLSVLWDVDVNYVRGKKFVHLWTPQDPRIYNDPDRERVHEVSFVGNPAYPERQMYLNHLRAANINVNSVGGQNRVEVEDYAKALQQSKISLNFSTTFTWHEQLKGRIFESMFCGAMLMESQYVNNWIGRWFLPGIHYVPFSGVGDLTDKVRYYLAHEDERLCIARNGQRMCNERYSNVAWWTYIFKECGIFKPETL